MLGNVYKEFFMKIVLLESLAISDAALNSYATALKNAGHEFVAYPKDSSEAVQIERAKDADVIILANIPLSAKVIEACSKLKYIDIAFTGYDHVAVDAAKMRGIQLSNASGYATESVAELVLGLAIGLLRNIPQVDQRCREGKTRDGLVGFELQGKTLGIVGAGAIGMRVAELFHALGCTILAYDPYPGAKRPDYITFAAIDEVLAQSDIVSLHCLLNDSTRSLINQERIGKMKRGAYLINAARGPVVDSAALADALNSGHLAGAGVDVFEAEPPLDTAHPLLHSKNTIVTPHIAFASKESMELRAEIVLNNLEEWLKGKHINQI
jgi:D-3-phosphoglycerate dehydrogenase